MQRIVAKNNECVKYCESTLDRRHSSVNQISVFFVSLQVAVFQLNR